MSNPLSIVLPHQFLLSSMPSLTIQTLMKLAFPDGIVLNYIRLKEIVCIMMTHSSNSMMLTKNPYKGKTISLHNTDTMVYRMIEPLKRQYNDYYINNRYRVHCCRFWFCSLHTTITFVGRFFQKKFKSKPIGKCYDWL